MFNVAKEAVFTRVVTVPVPDGAGHRMETFTATFRALTTEAAGAFDLATAEGSAALLRAAIVRLDDIANDSGKLDYSEEVLDLVLNLPYARAALALCYFREVQGAKEGN